MSQAPIVVTHTFAANIADVWHAISDDKTMRQWFFEQIPGFAPVVGTETVFDVHHNNKVYTHRWQVTEVAPEALLVYSWQYDGYPGDSEVRWELENKGTGTQLTLTHSGGETFPQDNPDFSRESAEAGWQYLIKESLADYLEQNSQAK